MAASVFVSSQTAAENKQGALPPPARAAPPTPNPRRARACVRSTYSSYPRNKALPSPALCIMDCSCANAAPIDTWRPWPDFKKAPPSYSTRPSPRRVPGRFRPSLKSMVDVPRPGPST
jgi:hypothetical protein